MGTISHSVAYGDIRLTTTSVLPAWLVHTTGNAIGNARLLSGLLQREPGRELLFSPGVESVVSIVLMAALGYWVRRRRTRGRTASFTPSPANWRECPFGAILHGDG